MRFRRSIKILPGLKLNIGKTGFSSLSIFKRGASLTMGSKGSYLNLGLPGTGLSHRIRLDKPGKTRAKKESKGSSESESILSCQNSAGYQSYVSPAALQQSWNAQPDTEVVEDDYELKNFAYNDALNQHHKIKSPPRNPKDAYFTFFSPEPAYPIISYTICLLSLLAFFYLLMFKQSLPMIISTAVVFTAGLYFVRRRLSTRKDCKFANLRMNELIGHALSGHFTAMEEIFGQILQQMDWVLETSASFEISRDGKSLEIDVNLPEIQDLERELSASTEKHFGVRVFPKKPWALQRDYQLLVHAIVIRLAGEVFYYFPTVKNVVISGFTDRLDKRTGLMRADYIISVDFERRLWGKINPALADPVECVGLFNSRRDIDGESSMKAIEPFADIGSR
ncbi:MAG: DUF4236 domain-containing protein [Deltaproteobacteria bacterium]|jgi:hypothetical protein|nr:DUF4236 domain-containing protein [Deltaproteobacteria bacterium]